MPKWRVGSNTTTSQIETNQCARAEDADVVEDEPAEAGDASMFSQQGIASSTTNNF